MDRSLLPPLPGKPDWYVEDAPRAIDPLTLEGAFAEPLPRAPRPVAAVGPAPVPEPPTLLPSVSPLAPQAFPTADLGRGMKRVKALAGRFKH